MTPCGPPYAIADDRFHLNASLALIESARVYGCSRFRSKLNPKSSQKAVNSVDVQVPGNHGSGAWGGFEPLSNS